MGRHALQRGASAVEYIGGIVVAALVVGAVILAIGPAGADIRSAVRRSVSTILQTDVTAVATAAVTVVVVGLWMVPSTPSGDVLPIVLGWVVVAFVLTAAHALVTSVAPSAGRQRDGPPPHACGRGPAGAGRHPGSA